MENLVMVFLKEPREGRVKTRLAASVGTHQAASIYRWLVNETLAVLPEAEGEATAVWIVFDPPDRGTTVRRWIEETAGAKRVAAWAFRAQAAGDLGRRMEAAFDAAFAAGFRRVAAIGTDCVELEASHLLAAWGALDGADVVFGPARDGGYYLLALAEPAPELFREIPWSTSRTLEASLRAAEAAGRRVHLLPRLSDVDTLEDWHRASRRQKG